MSDINLLSYALLKHYHKMMNIKSFDHKLIAALRRSYLPAARFSIFLIYFWFGALKLFDISPAEPLAYALVSKVIGVQFFDPLYLLLALLECIIGILFLFRKMNRIVLPLLFIHFLIIFAPLIILPEMTWQGFLVPTLEGQYIIKNTAIIAVAVGIAASTTPLAKKNN